MGIYINDQRKLFVLTTEKTEYAFCIDNQGLVRNLFWGEKIDSPEDYDIPELNEVSTNDPVFEITREEYPVYGGLRYKENCLKVTFEDGTRDIVYQYVGHTVEEGKLVLNLKDVHYGLEIELHYNVLADVDLIERHTVIKNSSNESIAIENIASGQVHIPYENLTFRNTHGHWGAEQQMFTQNISYGKIVFENRKGISGHNHNPYFIVDKDATETTGQVYFGALKLTGNFKGVVEQTPYGETLVQMGINDHDFLLHLEAGESFTTPQMVIGYSNAGLEVMSHNMHAYANKYILRNTDIRPVLYNSWEAMEFEVNAKEQIELAKYAKEIGTELFVVDDGWFGERHSTKDGLGDWYINEGKFPNGLEELIKEVKDMGMMFGIWFEPEMVNPLTKLYKEKPEWIYHFETREGNLSRDQYVLNMTKPEVEEFVYEMLDHYLTKYDIDYIKWDANRPISEPGAKNLGKQERSLWLKHIQAVYRIVDKLKSKHSNVLFEACASGGGRIDYGMLEKFDDFWTSDNTDAYDRLFIQHSYSHLYPIKAMRAWVTDVPNFLSKRVIPMNFRFDSSMMGTLGVGCNLLKLSEEELNICKEKVAEYKEIRHIVQDGIFYRLQPTLTDNDYHVFEYVKDEEALLFVFLPQTKIGHRFTTVKLRGLDENKNYEFMFNGENVVKSGKYLQNHGLNIRLEGDYASTIIKFKQA
ncbi:MAG: alpha-galactosidase [Peptostreptococcaceae bacterium]